MLRQSSPSPFPPKRLPKKLNFRLLIINFLPPTLSLFPTAPFFSSRALARGVKESLSSFLGGEVGLRGGGRAEKFGVSLSTEEETFPCRPVWEKEEMSLSRDRIHQRGKTKEACLALTKGAADKTQ